MSRNATKISLEVSGVSYVESLNTRLCLNGVSLLGYEKLAEIIFHGVSTLPANGIIRGKLV